MLYHPVCIGNVTLPGNLFLAPVAGYSDRAFRGVCREGGADFTYTEMVSAEALVRGSSKTVRLMQRAPGEKPYAVQLFGGTASVIRQAVLQILTPGTVSGSMDGDIPDVIDINAGCPVPKIVKTGAGSALTRDPERLYEVVQAAVEAACSTARNVPITVKIRSGWDAAQMTWKEAADAAVEAGAAAVTLHGRTRAQGYEGSADWKILEALTAHIVSKTAGKVPVFGSGDVFSPEDARRMLETTGCNAVMFARGALGNPFVFMQTRQLLMSGSYCDIPTETRIVAGMRELECLIADVGETAACRQMRKRFCAYSKGIPGGNALRSAIVTAETTEDYENIFIASGVYTR